MKNITLLCKVVDNYGDIGFVYRLSRDIKEKYPEAELRLVVSNLESFASMASGVDKDLPFQNYNGCIVLDWNNAEVCTKEFTETPPEVILECFQCGRPEWREDILFEKNDDGKVYQLINVEYLTAEEWADGFHLLKSGTRSVNVRKVNFMPGFSDKTGGLVLDRSFLRCLYDFSYAASVLGSDLENKCGKDFAKEIVGKLEKSGEYNVVLFSYGKDFSNEISALEKFQENIRSVNENFNVNLFISSGLTAECFYGAYEKTGKKLKVYQLPYLEQTAWDALLCTSDFNFVRGEDSFARASLSGKPFVWHAYLQDNEYQIVKVDAILRRMKNFMSDSYFDAYSKYMLKYNLNGIRDVCPEAQEILGKISMDFSMEGSFSCVLEHLLEERNQSSYKEFSLNLLKNGNLTENLMHYIGTL